MSQQEAEQPKSAEDAVKSADAKTKTKKPRPKPKMPTRAEWVLGVIALAVIVGWIVDWSRNGFNLFGSFFAAFSFVAALLMVAFIAAKPFHIVSLPSKVERNLLPVISLFPVLGYLTQILSSLNDFLTIGGSIALAYCSAITYWRKQFLGIAGKQLVENSEHESAPQPGEGEKGEEETPAEEGGEEKNTEEASEEKSEEEAKQQQEMA